MAERLVYTSIPVNVNSLNCIVVGVPGVQEVPGVQGASVIVLVLVVVLVLERRIVVEKAEGRRIPRVPG
ncbi:MAG TPA: hypothetical protein VF020_13775 [Chthoniobacterales bacterium]